MLSQRHNHPPGASQPTQPGAGESLPRVFDELPIYVYSSIVRVVKKSNREVASTEVMNLGASGGPSGARQAVRVGLGSRSPHFSRVGLSPIQIALGSVTKYGTPGCYSCPAVRAVEAAGSSGISGRFVFQFGPAFFALNGIGINFAHVIYSSFPKGGNIGTAHPPAQKRRLERSLQKHRSAQCGY